MECFPLTAPLGRIAFIIFIVLTTTTTSFCTQESDSFVQCLFDYGSLNTHPISDVIYTPINSSYSSVLNFSVQNLRFLTKKTPKPLAIITPSHVSHIQAAVICSKSHGLQIRTRSGGHDFEGLSYISDAPFIVVDLINLRSIAIDVENENAWVQSGATLGELYYRIAEKSQTLAFPAGSCSTVGVGGHLSGGGYGWLIRKYGLAADHVIDAYLVDANGKLHDRESMGEDLFWAIRGGGGGSFGIVVSWKVKLVRVPATVTVCEANRTLEEDVMKLIHEWQYVAPKLDANLLLGISLTGGKVTEDEEGKINPIASFVAQFLGKAEELMTILKPTFSQLGLKREDCLEISWIESVLLMGWFQKEDPIEVLLNRTRLYSEISKIKSDYVKERIPKASIKGMWERLKSQDVELAQIMFVPYGGRMSEVYEWETPYSHRGDYMYLIGYIAKWKNGTVEAEKRHLNWIREIYDYMTPFVSNSPRVAYVNYRDLDIGTNNKYDKTSYKRARNWGMKYFGNNFDRLVYIKTKVDPSNFFKHEQSIPILTGITEEFFSAL
ncbi:berberine bridge enzyme-like 18 [Benincasa hispida]|uniref:berberine bridge enzyme-like 18 n=1 Tax=Benincasa hispida TaxID=102211 RepID=UPI0018FF4991|nr:berberine bridge enzyme-like 18 [Benincasa hispida]